MSFEKQVQRNQTPSPDQGKDPFRDLCQKFDLLRLRDYVARKRTHYAKQNAHYQILARLQNCLNAMLSDLYQDNFVDFVKREIEGGGYQKHNAGLMQVLSILRDSNLPDALKHFKQAEQAASASNRALNHGDLINLRWQHEQQRIERVRARLYAILETLQTLNSLNAMASDQTLRDICDSLVVFYKGACSKLDKLKELRNFGPQALLHGFSGSTHKFFKIVAIFASKLIPMRQALSPFVSLNDEFLCNGLVYQWGASIDSYDSLITDVDVTTHVMLHQLENAQYDNPLDAESMSVPASQTLEHLGGFFAKVLKKIQPGHIYGLNFSFDNGSESGHIMGIRRINNDGSGIELFDPNFGVMHFDCANNFIAFFKIFIKIYDAPIKEFHFIDLPYDNRLTKSYDPVFDKFSPITTEQKKIALEGLNQNLLLTTDAFKVKDEGENDAIGEQIGVVLRDKIQENVSAYDTKPYTLKERFFHYFAGLGARLRRYFASEVNDLILDFTTWISSWGDRDIIHSRAKTSHFKISRLHENFPSTAFGEHLNTMRVFAGMEKTPVVSFRGEPSAINVDASASGEITFGSKLKKG